MTRLTFLLLTTLIVTLQPSSTSKTNLDRYTSHRRPFLPARMQLVIKKTWDGRDIEPNEFVTIRMSQHDSGIKFEVFAPFYSDPAPSASKGSLMHLWDYEVVEAFFLGDDNKYLEVEFGPHGHYIVLLLDGYRNVIKHSFPLEYHVTSKSDTRWSGEAIIPKELFPKNVTKLNSYAIHGQGEARKYLSLYPVETDKFEAPEFHRLDYFQPLDVSKLLPSNSKDDWSDEWTAALAN